LPVTDELSDVAILMDGVAVFIRIQVDREIDWLSAKCAGYFLARVTTHIASFGRSQQD
jgi:hypothetical protein